MIHLPTFRRVTAACAAVVLLIIAPQAALAVPPTIIEYPDFSSTSGLVLNGDAAQVGSVVRVAPAATDKEGSTWSTTQYDPALPFHSHFVVNMHDGTRADGLTFTVQNDSDGTAALGSPPGSNLGYAGISPSVAVEFDIFDSGASEADNNHVAILQDGSMAHLAVATPAFSMHNAGAGVPFNAWVDYDPSLGSNQLKVFVSQTATKPAAPLLEHTIDLETELGGLSYVGFTAATGGLTAHHDLLSWAFSTCDIMGTSGADNPLPGTAAGEVICALSGDDVVNAGGGGDLIYGGAGDDDLFGEEGNDGFNPGLDDPGADDYDGGTGGDRVFYDADPDTINNTVRPGSGADDGDVAANGGAGEDDDVKASTEHVDFGPGNDFFDDVISGVGADNTVRGGGGGDNLLGGNGKDLLLGQDGTDDLDGGGDNDKVNGGTADDSLQGGAGSDHVYGGAGTDGLCGDSCVPAGSDGNDLLYGGDNTGTENLDGDGGNDRIYGEGGADTLSGELGHDALFGGDESDALAGDEGNDALVPGPDDDDDSLQGGADTDRANYDNETGSVYAAIGAGGVSGTDGDGPGGPGDGSAEGDEIFPDVENITTGSGDDTLIGDADANYLLGNAGADTIFGGGGIDTLVGKTGDDFLIGSDDGATTLRDLLYCDGDTGAVPRDRFSADASDFVSQCETAAAPPP